jgi:DNA-binding helix-hairpin-helix protein with protein kinase domain
MRQPASIPVGISDLYTLNGQRISLSQELGRGGEGSIYAIAEHPQWVAKLYHANKLTPNGLAKLHLSLRYPPQNPAIAAPVDLLLNHRGQVLGFMMPRVPQGYPLHDLYTPRSRRQKLPFFTHTHLHRVARNLSVAVSALHHRGYVIGDVNESNMLVNPSALVFLIDTDSFQIRDRLSGVVYRCGVGKPEFTPPELQGKRFDRCDRTPAQDAFGVAVLIFQLLMEGTHPFDGVYLKSGEPPLIQDRILAGYYPYGQRSVPVRPKPFAPPLTTLHPQLQSLFLRCFETGHQRPEYRPTADEWAVALTQAEQSLISCQRNPRHRYGSHLARCPWCDRTEKLGGRDPFPGPNTIVPPVPKRRSRSKPKPPRRVEPTIYQAPPRRFARPKKPFRRNSRPWQVIIGGTLSLILGYGGYQQWQIEQGRQMKVQEIAQLYGSGQYERCLQAVRQVPLSVRERVQSLGDRCHLGQARQLVGSGQFSSALAELRRVDDPTLAQDTIAHLHQQIASGLLHEAQAFYNQGKPETALVVLDRVPQGTLSPEQRQDLARQWQQGWEANQQRFKAAQAALGEQNPQGAIAQTQELTTDHWQQQGQDLRDRAYGQLVNQALSEDNLSQAEMWLEKIQDSRQRHRLASRLGTLRDRLEYEANRESLQQAWAALYDGDFQLAQERMSQFSGNVSQLDRLGDERPERLRQALSNYRQLQTWLMSDDWQRANTWTRQQLQRFASRRVSCEEVQLLDQLWNEQSSGEQGLRQQLEYKQEQEILGQLNLSLEQQQQLSQMYPRRLVIGQTGADLDYRLANCLGVN